MSTPVLICDDSSFARKQMARALPADWDAVVNFAPGGEEALKAIRDGQGSVLFLDLNMPGMDGYQVLETIRAMDLPTMVIVVSGDIQPEARARVLKLGAMEFLKKPVDARQITEVLLKYGIYQTSTARRREVAIEVTAQDGYKEIANVAMGRAADRLARLLGAFVVMPIPNVQQVQCDEIMSMLRQAVMSDDNDTVSQGFIGSGVAGEALLAFDVNGYPDLAKLMKHQGELDRGAERELLLDAAGILTGACLNGIAEQLDIQFSHGHPVFLDGDSLRSAAARTGTTGTDRLLVIELGFTLEGRDIRCNMMLMFTPDSMAPLNERMSYVGS